MNVIFAMNIFIKLSTVKDVHLYVALHALISFILLIIIIVQYAAIEILNYLMIH